MPNRLTNVSSAPARTSTVLRATFLAALLAAAVPASATVTISVEAATNAVGNGDQADNAGNESPPGGVIHGVAAATRDAAVAFVANGGAGPCDFMAGVPGCAYELPQSRAVGEIRGDLGRLRGAVFANTDSSANVGLGVAELHLALRDVLMTSILGDLTFNLHFDVDNFVSGIPNTLHENLFQLQFSLQPLVAGATPTDYTFQMAEFESGLTVVDRNFVLSALPADAQVLMTLDILSRNECGVDIFTAGGSACSIQTNASNTAYIGVQGDYVSLSGYSYPGFAAAVPEPETCVMLVSGLGLLAFATRRRENKAAAAA